MAQEDVKALNDKIILRLRLPQRLALSYATRKSRDAFCAFFALDNALADIIRQAREPVLAQIRLAWWRDLLAKNLKDRPQGNPLVDLVQAWPAGSNALGGLVDGWESLLAEGVLDADAMAAFAHAKGACFAAIAGLCDAGRERDAMQAGQFWALVDLREGLSDAGERAQASDMAAALLPLPGRLGRDLRPLLMLSGLADRALQRGDGAILSTKGDMLAAVRLGLFGR